MLSSFYINDIDIVLGIMFINLTEVWELLNNADVVM